MVSTEKYTEQEIIARVVGGEKALYEIIVRRFNAYLYKIGRSYSYCHEDTQDLMQETFIDAYKSLAQFQGKSAFKTWIIRIMINNCYRKREKLSFKNEVSHAITENSQPMFSNSNNDTDSVVQNREYKQIVENALCKIALDYRMVFSLREITGLSVSETADLLNISENNVKVRLNRSKKLLRNEIEKTFNPSEIFEFNLIYCDKVVAGVMHEINTI